MDLKIIQMLFLIFGLIGIGNAYQQCNIICDDDHATSPTVGNPIRGKAGPKGETGGTGMKGEKGEAATACDCSSLDGVREEMAAMKKELAQLRGNPRDCYDIKQTYPMLTSGVYRIFPSFEATNGLEVYCDMETDGGGWIVFQNRQDGSVDFYRDWDDYVQGFGELTGEFWLGLEAVHQLTKSGNFILRIDMTDFEQGSAYAQYSSFSISEGTDYQLDYDEYRGTAGNGLYKHKFTTKDRDQDEYRLNCAVVFAGAWWYNSCHISNLNGLYLRGENDQPAKGVTWRYWRGNSYSLKTTQMKFRRADV